MVGSTQNILDFIAAKGVGGGREGESPGVSVGVVGSTQTILDFIAAKGVSFWKGVVHWVCACVGVRACVCACVCGCAGCA